jgi:hypothetical protein
MKILIAFMPAAAFSSGTAWRIESNLGVRYGFLRE